MSDSHLIDYVDENIVILDNMDATLSALQPLKMDCFLMVFCLEGEASLRINNKVHVLGANHCAILLPGTIIQHTQDTGTCNVRIVALSSRFIQSLYGLKKESLDIGMYLYYHPIFPVTQHSSYKLYLYKELALTSISDREHPYSREAKRHLFAAIFCEIMAALYQGLPLRDGPAKYRNDRSFYIFRRFMEKVTEDDGTHRTVGHYADMLCYSAKHLSTVIKKISGKAPLAIINEHAIERIKYQLRYSDKSMKEIADMFEFSNPSFFGKFVKQHLGISPQQYRNAATED